MRHAYIIFFLFGCSRISEYRVQRNITKGETNKALQISYNLLDKHEEDANYIKYLTLYRSALLEDIKANPSIPRLQSFIKNHSPSSYSAEAKSLLHELYLKDAKYYNSEALFLSVASTTSGVHQQKAMEEAEEIAFNELKELSTSSDLRAFQLRYPVGKYYEEVKTRAASLAYIEAQNENTVSSWSDFIRQYPQHQNIEQAKKSLRQAAWNLIQEGEVDVSQLWSYAHQYPSTDEGWNSAVQAFESGGKWEFLSHHDSFDWTDQNQVVSSLTDININLQSALPTSYKADIVVSVFHDEKWVAWEEAVGTWGEHLEVEIPETERVTKSESKGVINWSSQYGICSIKTEALKTKACIELSRGEKIHSYCKEVDISKQCAGKKALLFLTLEDDIAGPVAHFHVDAITKKVKFTKKEMTIPEERNCTQINSVSNRGIEILCEKSGVLIGESGDHIWFRILPKSMARSERLPLVDWKNEKRYPWRLSKGKLRKKRGNKRILSLNKRQLQFAPSVASNAFSVASEITKKIPTIPPSLEKPMNNNLVLPQNSCLIVPSDRKQSLIDQGEEWSCLENSSFGFEDWSLNSGDTEALVDGFKNLLKFQGNQITGSRISSQSGGGFHFIHLISDEQPFLLVLDSEKSAIDEWVQVIRLPLKSQQLLDFYAFEYQGNAFLRAVVSGATSSSLRLLTIYKEHDLFVMEVGDLEF